MYQPEIFRLLCGVVLGAGLWPAGNQAHAVLSIKICGASNSAGTGTCVDSEADPPPFSSTFGSNETGALTVTDGSGNTATLPLNPKTGLLTPSGWSSPASGLIDPTPPSTASQVTKYGSADPYIAATLASKAAAAAAIVTYFNNGQACGGTGQYAAELVSATAQGGTAASVHRFSNPYAAGCGESTADYYYSSATSCPVGYTVSGGTCINPVATTVQKPADSNLGVRRVGNAFVTDAADLDVVGGTVAAALAATISGSTATFGSAELGKTLTVTIGADGSVLATLTTPGATAGTSNVRQWGVGAPNATTGATMGNGYAAGTVAGAGSLADPTKPAGSSEGCGAPGQPACKIDEAGTPTTKGATFDAAGAALDAAKDASLAGMSTFNAATGAVALPTGVLPTLAGSDSCVEPVEWKILGNTVPLNLCGIYAPFKAVLGWVLWLGLAVFGWQRLTRGAITSGA